MNDRFLLPSRILKLTAWTYAHLFYGTRKKGFSISRR